MLLAQKTDLFSVDCFHRLRTETVQVTILHKPLQLFYRPIRKLGIYLTGEFQPKSPMIEHLSLSYSYRGVEHNLESALLKTFSILPRCVQMMLAKGNEIVNAHIFSKFFFFRTFLMSAETL